MDKDKKKKIIVAWFILIILIISLLSLNYIKFFGTKNPNIEEHPVENSTATAINTALKDIVKNFNNSEQVQEYVEQNVVIQASLNQYSIYINYITDTTVTYEFSYNNLNLDITIDNDQENLERFYKVYRTLIYAIQKRIGNEENLDALIDSFLSDSNKKIEYDGIKKEEKNQTIHYQINITKKLKDENKTE